MSIRARPEQIRPRAHTIAPSPFGERLAFLLLTSGSLESFGAVELRRGLCELRARYGSQRMVEFTSRFDLVLGTKPETLES